jgi:hypothetical protein
MKEIVIICNHVLCLNTNDNSGNINNRVVAHIVCPLGKEANVKPAPSDCNHNNEYHGLNVCLGLLIGVPSVIKR